MSTTFVNFFKLASPPQNLPQQGRRFRWNTGGRSVPVAGAVIGTTPAPRKLTGFIIPDRWAGAG